MKKTLYLLFLLCTWTMLVHAIPAKPGQKKVLTLANGTTIQATLVGDEHGHFYVDANGKAYNRASGKAFYQEVNSGNIISKAKVRRSQVNTKRVKRLGAAKVGEVGSYIGQKKGIVILVNYTDVKWQSSNTLALFKRIANEENFSYGSFKGSMYDYFKAQSGGQFELTFDVVGPVTVAKKQSYYGGNDTYGNDEHAAEMVIEACKLADSQVNFANYDWDGDGYVDQVYVVYAGQGEADGGSDDTIWPHAYDLESANYYGDGSGVLTLDGVKINTYACGSELNGSSELEGIGTMCHEFSHCLGYPDFYDIDYSGGQGMYSWDLMDMGSYNDDGYQPAGYTSYERWVAGWQEPIELTNTTAVTDMKGLQDGGESYIIYNDNNRNEYFLLENRTQTGWDASLPGGGMLIIHVDYDATVWSNNKPNDDASHQRMTWVPADGSYNASIQTSGSYKYVTISDANLAKDLWPQSGKTVFGSQSTGNTLSKLWTANSEGSNYLNVSVEDITKDANGLISFNFQGQSNVATPTFSPAAGRYSEPQTVTITCSDADTDIYYTLDGSKPTSGSTAYTAPFVVSETTTVKAIAINGEGEESNVATAKYTIVDGNQLLYEGVSAYSAESDGSQAIGTDESDLDYDGWTTLTKVYKGGISNAKENGGCLKLGANNAAGSVQASNIALTGDGTLVFSLKKYNKDTGKLNLTVTGATADVTQFTPSDTWTEYTVNLTGGTGNVSITLATSAKRAYIDEIELLSKSGSSTKKNVTMSFSQTAVQATLGETFVAPVLTIDPSGLAVTYSSSNTNIATVTSDGQVTLKAAGTATITAKFAGNDEYNSAQASYTLTVMNAGGETATTVEIPYENTLLGSHNDFTIEDVSTGGLEAVWKDNASYGMTANGYKCTGDIESWFISPVFNGTNATSPKLTLSHGINYFASVDAAKSETGVYIREEGASNWTALTVEYPASLSNTFLEGVEVDLSAYAGKKFQLGFKYTATAAKPGRWQIKNLSVTDSTTPVIEVPTLTPSKTSATEGEVVTITVSQTGFDGDDGTEIWYTTDGSDPTTSSTKRVLDDSSINTISVTMGTADVEVKAVAVSVMGQPSAETSVTITYQSSSTSDAEPLPYEDLSSSLGKFTADDSDVWTWSSSYNCAVGKKQGGAIGWLISPLIDLTTANDPTLTFTEMGNYFKNGITITDNATVWVREGESGSWTQLSFDTRCSGTAFSSVASPTTSLASYKGKKVQIGFKYESTSSAYGTWEVKDFKVTDGEAVITYLDETIESLNGKTGAAISNISLNLNNAKVVYVDATQGAYVREGDYAIQFFKTGLSLTAGQTMTGSIKFNYAPYYGIPEVKDIDGVTNLDDVTFGATETPVAVTVSLDNLVELAHVADFVSVSGVTIEYVAPTSAPENDLQRASSATYYAVSGETKVQLYDKFGNGLLNEELNGKTATVEGIFGAIYSGAPEIFPTKITTEATGINNIDFDTENGKGTIYNLSGQRVDKNYKGIVIYNGKKLLLK